MLLRRRRGRGLLLLLLLLRRPHHVGPVEGRPVGAAAVDYGRGSGEFRRVGSLDSEMKKKSFPDSYEGYKIATNLEATA